MTESFNHIAKSSIDGWEFTKPSDLGIVIATTSAIIIVRFIIPLILKRSSNRKILPPPWVDEQKFLTKSPGLYNHGNICYANSVMQAISTSRSLLKTLKLNDYQDPVLEELSYILHVLGTESVPNSFENTCLLSLFKKLNDGHAWNKSIEDQEDCFDFYLAVMDYFRTKHEAYLKEKNSEESPVIESDICMEIKVGYRFSCEKCFNSNDLSVVQSEFCINLNLLDDDVMEIELDEMLKNIFRTELIEESKCEFCPEIERETYKRCYRKTSLIKCPKLLAIRINRVYYDRRGRRYLNRKKVNYQLYLNINNILESTRKRKRSRWDMYPYYRLVSVISHYGSVYNGHYVCHKLWPTIETTSVVVKDKIPHHERTWNYISDTTVEEVTALDLNLYGALPCMFFYERV